MYMKENREGHLLVYFEHSDSEDSHVGTIMQHPEGRMLYLTEENVGYTTKDVKRILEKMKEKKPNIVKRILNYLSPEIPSVSLAGNGHWVCEGFTQ